MAGETDDGLDANILAAIDEVLIPGACDQVLLSRLRRLIENCLADNYDQSDVLAVIELGIEKRDDEGKADDGS